MTTTKCFRLERDPVEPSVAHLRLARPESLNTMVPEFWSELPRVVRELDRTGETRVLVISSTGRHFSAGMDLSVFTSGAVPVASDAEVGRVRANLRLLVKNLQDSFSCLERARFPVVAAIQGGCIGGAVDMVCACDLRYASRDAFFCIQETNIGIVADVGTLQRLPKLIPEAVAREWAYTGDRIPARRAWEVGFLNGIFDDHESLVEGALEVARRIAKKSPLVVWGVKEAITYARDHSVEDALDRVALWQTGMLQPTDMVESFAAKEQGRDPEYQDLLAIRDEL